MTVPPDDEEALAEQRRREEAIERGRLLAARAEPEVFIPQPVVGAKKMLRLGLFAIGALAVLGAGYYALRSGRPSDAEVRERIIKESIALYQATGRPCACPFNVMANGTECGDFSAYRIPGAAAPLCFAKDVSDAQVSDWRRRNPN